MAGALSVGVSMYLVNYLRRDLDPLDIPAELLSGTNYKEELKVAVQAALAAGANMQRDIGMSVKNDVQTKFNSIDFATETDRANELIIFDMLKQRFPQGHVFIGEESSAENNTIPALTSVPTWIVDPM
jgi:fructose-1,6-bisphosphatase/inositol monophosphatase family enzyme